jgi:hypothetical protein
MRNGKIEICVFREHPFDATDAGIVSHFLGNSLIVGRASSE